MRRPAGSQALAFVFITALLDSIGFGIIMPVLPQLVMDVTGEGLSQAARYGGALMFAYAGMQFFLAPVIGNLSDRFGRRPILLASLFVLGIDYLVDVVGAHLRLVTAGPDHRRGRRLHLQHLQRVHRRYQRA